MAMTVAVWWQRWGARVKQGLSSDDKWWKLSQPEASFCKCVILNHFKTDGLSSLLSCIIIDEKRVLHEIVLIYEEWVINCADLLYKNLPIIFFPLLLPFPQFFFLCCGCSDNQVIYWFLLISCVHYNCQMTRWTCPMPYDISACWHLLAQAFICKCVYKSWHITQASWNKSSWYLAWKKLEALRFKSS